MHGQGKTSKRHVQGNGGRRGKGRTKAMFSKVREITRKATPRMGSLKAEDEHNNCR